MMVSITSHFMEGLVVIWTMFVSMISFDLYAAGLAERVDIFLLYMKTHLLDEQGDIFSACEHEFCSR